VWTLALAALPVLLTASAGGRELDVRATGARVTIHVQAASLTDVLDQVARRTGMKVVYDGRPPHHLVSAKIDDADQADAVFRLLEGLGINYALAMDQAGQHVETLIITGAARPDLADQGPAPSRPQPAFHPGERPKFTPLRGAPPQAGPPPDAVDADDEPEDPVAAAKGLVVEDDPDEPDDEPEPQRPPGGLQMPVPNPSPSPIPQ
jgi:hypothetical protein